MGLEHQRLIQVIHRLTGVFIEEDKIYLLDSRLGPLMKERGIAAFDGLATILESGKDGDFIDQVIDRITTHETRFFRDESIFDCFVMQIVPEWLKRQGAAIDGLYGNRLQMVSFAGRTSLVAAPADQGAAETGTAAGAGMPFRMNIWSAACSTGQEPYSLAMILNEKHPRLAPYVQITATDISRDVLRRAETGVFTRFEIGRGLPDAYRNRYFVQLDENSYRIKDEIRNRVRFEQHNLVTDQFPSMFDVIFCRNVSIYFTDQQKKILYGKLRDSLRSDGVLALGSAESLSGYLDNFIIREFGLARYYELKPSQVFMF